MNNAQELLIIVHSILIHCTKPLKDLAVFGLTMICQGGLFQYGLSQSKKKKKNRHNSLGASIALLSY